MVESTCVLFKHRRNVSATVYIGGHPHIRNIVCNCEEYQLLLKQIMVCSCFWSDDFAFSGGTAAG